MLPAFDNVLRFTDHGEATYFGCNTFEVIDLPAGPWHQFTLKPRTGHRSPDKLMFASAEALVNTAELFAK